VRVRPHREGRRGSLGREVVRSGTVPTDNPTADRPVRAARCSVPSGTTSSRFRRC